jgi:hypothetical protein
MDKAEIAEALQLLRDIKDLLTRAEERQLADREQMRVLQHLQRNASRLGS